MGKANSSKATAKELVPAKRKRIASSTSSDLIPYPETDLKFASKSVGKHFAELRDKKELAPTVTPHMDSLRKLGIDEEVRDILMTSGLAVLITEREVAHYSTPTFEFVSSFETYDDDGERGWKFQLGGQKYKRSNRWLCELFMFPIGGTMPSYDVSIKDEFWKEITNMDLFVPMMSPKMIHVGVWKVIHRIIAMSFYARKEGGRLVHNNDLDAMIAMKNGDVVDWLQILGNMFENFWKPITLESNVVGGTLFVTLIGKALGYDLDSLTPYPTKPFDLSRMVSYNILGNDKKTWYVDLSMSERLQRTLHNRRKKIAAKEKKKGLGRRTAHLRRRELEFSSDEEEVEPSKYEDLVNRLEKIEVFADEQRETNKKLENFMDEQRETNRLMRDAQSWMMTSFAGFAANQGFSGFAPPPPMDFTYPPTHFGASSEAGPSSRPEDMYMPTFDSEFFPPQDPPAP